jgi:Protein of unknown function (DUF1566)
MSKGCNFNKPDSVTRRSMFFALLAVLFLAIVALAQCAPGTENEVASRCAMAFDSYYNRCEVGGVSYDVHPSNVKACEDNEDEYESFLKCYDECSSCDDFEGCLGGEGCGDGDGTASDSSSGLTWQVTPSGDDLTWDEAKTYCQNLPLEGGGWHLPTISELRSLIRGCDATETGGSCGVTEDCLYRSCRNSNCGGCLVGDVRCYWPPELNGSCYWYWSSSAIADVDDNAWFVNFMSIDSYGAYVAYGPISDDIAVRCVR